MSKCCDPCPWCGADVNIEEFYTADDYAFIHECEDQVNCGWQEWMGRDTTKEEWDAS